MDRLTELVEKWRNQAQAQEVEAYIIEDKLRRGETVMMETTTASQFVAPGRKFAAELEAAIAAELSDAKERKTQPITTFEEWHAKQATCCKECADSCPHMEWERRAFQAGRGSVTLLT
jgi:hypothetical protein